MFGCGCWDSDSRTLASASKDAESWDNASCSFITLYISGFGRLHQLDPGSRPPCEYLFIGNTLEGACDLLKGNLGFGTFNHAVIEAFVAIKQRERCLLSFPSFVIAFFPHLSEIIPARYFWCHNSGYTFKESWLEWLILDKWKGAGKCDVKLLTT